MNFAMLHSSERARQRLNLFRDDMKTEAELAAQFSSHATSQQEKDDHDKNEYIPRTAIQRLR